ncbi:MAG: glycosyltransferase [Planctomycetaceae bacterium]|nr:glycosyltransferase [Planctomycetaceae bacterium]
MSTCDHLRETPLANAPPSGLPLRIVQVMASGPGSGGIEKHFFDLCNRLAEQHTVVAVAHPAYRAGLRAAVQFESLGRLIGRRNPLTVLRLVRILQRWRPDVVHAHASRAAAIVLQASPWCSAARVATVHGLKRRTLVFRGFDRVIAVSRGVASRLTGVNADVIYNGIDIPAIQRPAIPKHPRTTLNRDGHHPLVISVGRLDHVKGFDVLMDAWQDVDGRLQIAGEGPQRKALEAQIIRLGLTDRVELLGFRRDIPDLLATADLTVIASRREGFGYTLAEALLLRRPVVATNVPAANEILPPQFLVPCGDAAALRRAISHALAKPTELASTFEPVWNRAAAEFTLEAMTAATDRLYADLVQSRIRRLSA